MAVPTIEQFEAQQSLARQLRQVTVASHAAEEVRDEGRRVREELDRLLQSVPPEWRDGDKRVRVRKIRDAMQPVAVWLLDVVFLYFFVDFYIRNFPGLLRQACLLLVPAVVAYLEVYFAGRAAESRQAGDEAGARLWNRVAVIWALAVTAGVGAVAWVQNEDFSLVMRILLTFTLSGITLVAHLMLAKSGDRVLDGLAYWRFSAGQRKLEQRAARLEGEARRREQAAADAFLVYMANYAGYSQAYPNGHLQAGPFDRLTQEVLHRIFGYPVIQTTGGNGRHTAPNVPPQPPAAPPPAVAANPSDGDGEVAYLREILERRIRDEEGEVRP
ncbi:MAG: hypothetical protein ACUVXB_16465 [Bryobacteraceae bacterium]